MRKNLQFLPLHEAVKRGLGKTKPQVLVTPEFGAIGIHFRQYRIGVRQLGVQLDGLFESRIHHIGRERPETSASSYQLFEGCRVSS